MKTFDENASVSSKMPRRSFLQFAGAGALAAGMLTASSCKKNKNTGDAALVNIGTGDIGILNYAYALEQLEAAFYTQVIATPYSGMPGNELSLLTDIRDHEVAHREFFKAALGSAAIPALTPNFAGIDFTSRASVLKSAMAFEDLGVSAYNGAGASISSATYLGLAGKIVSVEARHASFIRNLLTPNTFVGNDVITLSEGTSIERSKTPAQVVPVANQFVSGARLVAPQFGLY